MKNLLVKACILSLSSYAMSGDLVLNGTISEVANSSNDKDVFFLKFDSGEGPCAVQGVTFSQDTSQSKESYDQAFSIALAAAISGKKVQIHNYDNDSCLGANFIRMYIN